MFIFRVAFKGLTLDGVNVIWPELQRSSLILTGFMLLCSNGKWERCNSVNDSVNDQHLSVFCHIVNLLVTKLLFWWKTPAGSAGLFLMFCARLCLLLLFSPVVFAQRLSTGGRCLLILMGRNTFPACTQHAHNNSEDQAWIFDATALNQLCCSL